MKLKLLPLFNELMEASVNVDEAKGDVLVFDSDHYVASIKHGSGNRFSAASIKWVFTKK